MREILIYKVIGNDSDKHFLAEWFVNELNWLESDRDVNDVMIRFNTPGGDVFAGFAIISKMDETELETNGMIDGMAASMGAYIALKCDNLKMNANAKIMLHLPQASPTGDAVQLRAIADQMDEMRDKFAQIIANKAGITTDKAIELYLQPSKDVWLNADEALAAGLIDEIVGEKMEIAATANSTELWQAYAQIINDTNINSNMDKLKFLAVLGAAVGTVTAQSADAEFYARVAAIVAENTKLVSDLAKSKLSIKAFNDAAIVKQSEEVEILLTAAVEDKRLLAENKPSWVAMFKANHEETKTILATLPKPASIKDFIEPGKDGNPTTAELKAKWDAADNDGTMEKIKADDYPLFEAMFKAKFGKAPNKS